MPQSDKPLDFDPGSPPFDQFEGIQALTSAGMGHLSETPRHRLYVGSDRQTRTNILIKVAARPGLIYQANLRNEIASLLTVNRSLPDSPYFPLVLKHGDLRDGRVYVVVSFFPELALATGIGRERIPGKSVAYIRTAMEVARALGELHSLAIYHVDLNPMNILVRLKHGRPVIRIVDFESSYEAARHSAGVFYNPPTTSGYSAPEIPSQSPDARSDVFSLGAVLYTMLAGYEWTWRADVETCVSGDGDLDTDLQRILLRAVDARPANRFPSMAAFYADLASYLESIWPGRKAVAAWGRPERESP